MSAIQDEQDRHLDETLREAGRRSAAPHAPTARQVQQWMTAHERGTPANIATGDARRGGVTLFTGRWRSRTMTLAGSAVAATIAFAAFLLGPSSMRVEAATILASFRQSLSEGFRVSFGELGADGLRVGGDFTLLAGGPGDGPGALWMRLSIDAVDAPRTFSIPWRRIDLEAALNESRGWMHLRTGELDADYLAEHPMMSMVDFYTSGGVLMKLDDLMPFLRKEVLAEVDQAWSEVRRDLSEDGFDINVTLSGQQADGLDADWNRLLRRLLAGQADVDELLAAVEPLAQAAATIEVTSPAPGLHALRIADIRVDNDADEDFLGRIEIEVHYQEGRGVLHAELRNIGPYAGWLRIEAADAREAALAMNPDRLLQDGRTRTFDLGGVLPLLEQFGMTLD